jgi:putative DNA primase/helicase
VTIDSFPLHFRDRAQWVVWKLELKPDSPKPTKVPYQPLARGAKKAASDDSSTWGTLGAALTVKRLNDYDGLGYMLTLDDGVVFIDLDGCRDAVTSEITADALAIIQEVNSYTELSPSGTGVHILAYGELPPGGRRRKGHIEMYSSGRYATMTGQHLEGTPLQVEPRAEQITKLHIRIFTEPVGERAPEPPRNQPGRTMSDEDILSIASRAANRNKFLTLWRGEITGYDSGSEADLALCDILAFYTQDETQLERLVAMSGLGRDKWQRRDYRERTVRKAINGLTARYGDSRHNGRAKHTNGTSGPPHPADDDSGGHMVEDIAAQNDILTNAPLSDTGNAECFALLYSEQFRFDHTRKKWLTWTGARWQVDEDGATERAAIDVIRKRKIAALSIADTDRQKKMINYLISAENAQKQKGLLTQAGVLGSLSTTIARFDTGQWIAGAPNGLLDMEAGLLYEPDRDDLITLCLGTPFLADASCPRWVRFLSEVFAGDQELTRFIQRAVGYSLTGDTSEQVMFLCHGSGANGKSVFLETLSLMLGDYAAGTPFATFDADRRTESTNDLAALKGKRFVTVIESDEDRRLAEARVKAVTGQDAITCRFLYGEFFTYRPSFKLWMAMNHKPIIRGTDRGIWRRIKLIPFTQNFEGRADKNLSETLRSELPGILSWALQGLKAWREGGLGSARVVDVATEEYRKESDLLGQWFEDCAVSDPREAVPASEAYDSFRNWCKSYGFREPTQTAFGRAMEERGFAKARTSGKRVYQGLKLLVPMIVSSDVRDRY